MRTFITFGRFGPKKYKNSQEKDHEEFLESPIYYMIILQIFLIQMLYQTI